MLQTESEEINRGNSWQVEDDCEANEIYGHI